MKILIILIAFLSYLHGFTQVIPNVSIDSISSRLFPIYFQAFKKGVYDLPPDTSFQTLQTYQTSGLSLQVPDKWLNLGGVGSIVEVAFDASGLYFPDTFNNRPILLGVFLLNQAGNSLDEAKSLALKDYRSNADRVFEPNYLDSVFESKLASGHKCYVLHTRFLRNSSQLNQSRYDLVFFSEKIKKGYSVMLSVQYADPSYSFEYTNHLGVLAARLFSHVMLE